MRQEEQDLAVCPTWMHLILPTLVLSKIPASIRQILMEMAYGDGNRVAEGALCCQSDAQGTNFRPMVLGPVARA